MVGPPVIAAFDGRSSSSVKAGRLLSRLLGVPLVVATAYHHEVAGGDPETDRANERRLAAADAALRRARQVVPPREGTEFHAVPAGDLAATLAALAHQVEACAIAVTEDRHGTVARDVLHAAPCPTLVSPGDPLLVPDEVATVGVAFDGSVHSRFALIAGARIAERAGGRLELLGVARRRDRTLQRVLTEAAASVEGVEARAVLLDGDPATALRGAAEKVDLLVCGSHGRGHRLAALLGSVSSVLVQGPAEPVLVVPVLSRPEDARPLALSHARASRT